MYASIASATSRTVSPWRATRSRSISISISGWPRNSPVRTPASIGRALSRLSTSAARSRAASRSSARIRTATSASPNPSTRPSSVARPVSIVSASPLTRSPIPARSRSTAERVRALPFSRTSSAAVFTPVASRSVTSAASARPTRVNAASVAASPSATASSCVLISSVVSSGVPSGRSTRAR